MGHGSQSPQVALCYTNQEDCTAFRNNSVQTGAWACLSSPSALERDFSKIQYLASNLSSNLIRQVIPTSNQTSGI